MAPALWVLIQVVRSMKSEVNSPVTSHCPPPPHTPATQTRSLLWLHLTCPSNYMLTLLRKQGINLWLCPSKKITHTVCKCVCVFLSAGFNWNCRKHKRKCCIVIMRGGVFCPGLPRMRVWVAVKYAADMWLRGLSSKPDRGFWMVPFRSNWSVYKSFL